MNKEEALNILRDLHEESLFSVRTALETIVPEFKESEGEKIRKFLIKMARNGHGGDKEWWDKCVAWLEKQSGPTAIDIDKMVDEFEHSKVMSRGIPSLAEVDAYRKGVTDALSKILIREEKDC